MFYYKTALPSPGSTAAGWDPQSSALPAWVGIISADPSAALLAARGSSLFVSGPALTHLLLCWLPGNQAFLFPDQLSSALPAWVGGIQR